jgi:diguanylate cyclase (GGDEF)-like protein
MLDFDHFKQINDTHGHLIGDQVLKSVIDYFLGELRQYDNVFRYGGEEFLLMFPDTGLQDAEALLQRISAGLKTKPVLLDGGVQLSVTVSIGLAVMDGKTSERRVIEAADCALISAKLSGRDCIQVCE